MYDTIQLNQILNIIEYSDKDDIILLKKVYQEYSIRTDNPIEKEQFIILVETVNTRIDELSKIDD